MLSKVLFIFISIFTTNLSAQIIGTVLNLSDGKPIVGANIIFEGNGTSTNSLGKFSLDVSVGIELEISHIGFKPLTQKAETIMIIELEPYPIKADEIIVLSGLNDESLQRLGSSVTVIASDELKRSSAQHFQTLIDQIPNLTWAGGTSRPRYFQIRGIGERSHYFGEGAPNFSVGFILDDIDLSGIGMLGHLFDLQQIEVFKGPQSSIFGANAIAGLISLRSVDPLDRFEHKHSFSIGNDNHLQRSNSFNFSLNGGLSFRLSSIYNYRDGFRKNIFKRVDDSNKKEEMFYRMKARYRPSKNIDFISTLIYADMPNGYDVWSPDNNKNYETYSDADGEDSQNTLGGSARLNISFSKTLKFTSITSSTKSNLVHAYDGDWANDAYWFEQHGFDSEVEGWSYSFYDKNKKNRKNFTQELRLSKNKLIFGMFYKNMKEEDRANGYLFGGLATDAISKYDFEAFSSYLQFDRDILSRLKLLSNFRIEKNTIEYNGTSSGLDDYWESVELPIVKYATDNLMLGYRTSLIFNRNNSTSFTSSFARGYKSGGVNQQPYLNELSRPYGPEALITAEIGVKHQTRNFRSSFICFYGLRKNQQVSISSQQVEGDPNSFIYYTSNAGSGYIAGIEWENKLKILPRIELDLSIGYLDTWVDSFNYFIADGIKGSGGNRQAAMSPKLNGSINLFYHGPIGLSTSLNTSFKSDYYYSDSHNEKSRAYSSTDLSISKALGKSSKISLWTRNIFDKRYTTRGFYFALIPPEYPEQLWESYADPRQLGLTYSYSL